MFTGVLQHRSYGAQGCHIVQTDFSQKGCFLPFQLFFISFFFLIRVIFLKVSALLLAAGQLYHKDFPLV